MNEVEPMLPSREIEKLLHISNPTLQRLALAGKIPSYRLDRNVTRFRLSEVEAALRNIRTGPPLATAETTTDNN